MTEQEEKIKDIFEHASILIANDAIEACAKVVEQSVDWRKKPTAQELADAIRELKIVWVMQS